MSNKKALITGITGQDGSYLAEFLLSKGYTVYGLSRRTSTLNTQRISHLLNDITLIHGDLSDEASLVTAIKESCPDEVYNLAAQSFVGSSWTQPLFTSDITGIGVLRLLEAIRSTKSDTKFYQASSSEMFGKVRETPQNENTPFYPRSPYGVSKMYGHWITTNYRESYNMFACNGILFNHESPRRGLEFVTKKISNAVARIYYGLQDELLLGNLDAKRDWGFAGDYVEAMYMMLQQKKPSDYVISTGEAHSVREFCELAFNIVGLDYQDYVKIDSRFLRPSEVDLLLGDCSKAKRVLGWIPKISFKELVRLMVEKDLELIANQKSPVITVSEGVLQSIH